MQFIANGPDVPDTLLQAHEEGRVVLFCGAGISYPAGLPGFRKLVEDIFAELGTDRNELEDAAMKVGRLDAVVDLLEHRYPGHRNAVRAVLPKLLTPTSYRRKKTTATHRSLLDLASDRSGVLRLVTTNFDRIFEHVAKGRKRAHQVFSAPLLPVPKPTRWNGLVYLHGLLDEKPNVSSLNRLVLSSGDFGLAYLSERWAARFVSELFRNFVVCFIGYSIDDPVVRYMMDALAADRMLGEVVPDAYAFGPFSAGLKAKADADWRAKGVTPVLYESLPDEDHSLLHRTLWAWANTYRDGVQGKERIVTEYSMAEPLGSTEEDNFVGRMMWALSDKNGNPAARFADAIPCPSIDWLRAFSDNKFKHEDLVRFGVSTVRDKDDGIAFSLIDRPAPYSFAPRMSLFHLEHRFGWDSVMHHIARWAIRHLNSPEFLHFVVGHGARPVKALRNLIQGQLNTIESLESEGRSDDIAELIQRSPNSVPDQAMRKLWRLVLGECVKKERDYSFYEWRNDVVRGPLSSPRLRRLIDLLRPKVSISAPYRAGSADEAESRRGIARIANCEVVLAASESRAVIVEMAKRSDWQAAMRKILPDLELLLRDTCLLMVEIDATDSRFGRSHWDMPSISDHWQNRGFHDWVTLIEIIRDAWLSIKGERTKRAMIARGWIAMPFGVFKRLALFAASREKAIEDEEWISWLTVEGGWWLWSVETMREAMRLIVLRGRHLSDANRRKLEKLILLGPPRRMFRRGLPVKLWQDVVSNAQWLRLSKLESSGVRLSPSTKKVLAGLSVRWPKRKLAKDQSDEFSSWMGGTGDPGFEDQIRVEKAPRNLEELVPWLSKPPTDDFFTRNDWQELCREDLRLSTCAIRLLARRGIWPTRYWRTGLQVWSNETQANSSWNKLARTIAGAPDDVVVELAGAIAGWFESAAKVFVGCERYFVLIALKVLVVRIDGHSEDRSPLTQALNHPVGQIMQGLLHRWYRDSPKDGEGLPIELAEILTVMFGGVSGDQYRHARLLAAANALSLYRVDVQWSQRYLLPRFSWDNVPNEAALAWQGFLWSPRLYWPFLVEIKGHLLATAEHDEELGETRDQYARFMTYLALNKNDAFTVGELRQCFTRMAPRALQHVARALASALKSAEQQGDYWKNRFVPFWKNYWPKSYDHVTQPVSSAVSAICISSGDHFEDALAITRNWILRSDDSFEVTHDLLSNGLCAKFPSGSLDLLDLRLADGAWFSDEVAKCLDQIQEASAILLEDPRFVRLRERIPRRG